MLFETLPRRRYGRSFLLAIALLLGVAAAMPVVPRGLKARRDLERPSPIEALNGKYNASLPPPAIRPCEALPLKEPDYEFWSRQLAEKS
jgi:hypothetical protein